MPDEHDWFTSTERSPSGRLRIVQRCSRCSTSVVRIHAERDDVVVEQPGCPPPRSVHGPIAAGLVRPRPPATTR